MAPRARASSKPPRGAGGLGRRELIVGAGAGAAALLLGRSGVRAQGQGQALSGGTVVFTHTKVVNADAVQDDVALAVRGRHDRGDRSHRRGFAGASSSRGLRRARQGAVSWPHQLSCTYGRPSWLAVSMKTSDSPIPIAWTTSPSSLLRGRGGHADGHRRGAGSHSDRDHDHRTEHREHQPAMQPRWPQTGLRCVFAESVRDSENVAGPMSPERLAASEVPEVFTQAARDEGLAAHQ